MVNRLRYQNEDYIEQYLSGGTVVVAYNPDDVTCVWLKNGEIYKTFLLVERRFKGFHLLLTDNFFVSEEELNTDEDIINFQNGLLRLSDMTLLPHTPELITTIQLPCDWPPAPSETPVYDRYMKMRNSVRRSAASRSGRRIKLTAAGR